jgi:hypothetical protein
MMTNIYTVQLLSVDGCPRHVMEVDCGSRDDAVDLTMLVAAGCPAELWRGDQKLFSWSGYGTQRPN